MAERTALLSWLLIGFFYFLTSPHICRVECKSTITRHDFPSNFIFGAGTSAYQVEGAAAVDGRKPSIWDTLTHAGNMPDESTGDIAADQYHHYKEDVSLMSEMGLDAYRFSISWSRLIPDGRGLVNTKGVEYYNNLINELISHGNLIIERSLISCSFSAFRIIEPVIYGEYPASMKKIVGSRLPSFTKQESEKLRGSFDFIGLVHYTTKYVSDSPTYRDLTPRDFIEDLLTTTSVYRNGIPIGELAPTGLPIVPWGMQALLEYFKGHYDNPPVIINENGYGRSNNESLPLEDALNDEPRVAYLHDYVESLLAAVRNGSNARGYFVWSFVDSFEVLHGYTTRYGLYYVDFKDRDLKRYPTLSVRWYTHFLKKYKGHRPVLSSCFIDLS